MKRHPFDAVSFVFGLVFAALAAVYLAAPQLDWDVAGPWLLPGALIALGVAAIAGAVGGLRSGRERQTLTASTSEPEEAELSGASDAR